MRRVIYDLVMSKNEFSISIRQAVAKAAHVLRSAGIVQARMEASSLLSHLLHKTRTFLIAHGEDHLNVEQLAAFQRLVARRAQREPLQYITGHQEFFSLDFQVTPAVLIPRPETEIVVEAALDSLKGKTEPAIADIGTGSGCIIISLLHQLPNARGVATDISLSALAVTRTNAHKHGVGDRLDLIQADCFSAFPRDVAFSIIVSNPPYVAAAEIDRLQPEVREYEPLSALVSGSDGLAHIGTLLAQAAAFLCEEGQMIFEIGFGQREAVERLIDERVWNLIEIRTDLQGIPRTVVVQKQAKFR